MATYAYRHNSAIVTQCRGSFGAVSVKTVGQRMRQDIQERTTIPCSDCYEVGLLSEHGFTCKE